MVQTEEHFEGRGGVDIFRRAWLPEGEPKATVVISHGAGEHCGRYAGVAEQLVAAGYAVHALDHRGHGRSSGRRAYIDRMHNVVADLHSVVTSVGRPFLLGHSMGGCIAIEYALAHQDSLRALALSSPLAHLAAANPAQRAAGKVLSAFAPWVPVFSVDSSKVSRDPEVVRDYDTDPLVHHDGLPARTVAELADTVGSFPERVPSLTLPLLVMLGTADEIVPPKGGRMVHDNAGSPDKSLEVYEGLFHEILFEPEGREVAADLITWLDAH